MNLLFNINKPIETVFDYLSDMQKFASVHPVINKIDHVAEKNYLVYETLKFGFIPFSFNYPVTIEQNLAEKKVIMRASVMRLTKVKMDFTLTQNNNATIIDETITFASILPVKSIMERVFRKHHTHLFENIEAVK